MSKYLKRNVDFSPIMAIKENIPVIDERLYDTYFRQYAQLQISLKMQQHMLQEQVYLIRQQNTPSLQNN